MILNRLGNKTDLAKDIQTFFPEHKIYMEPFFGAGGMFFNKPKCTHNFVADIDSDVYNLFRQLIDNKDELVYLLNRYPITEKQFKEWGKGKKENTDVLNALRFIIISNFGLYGKTSTMRVGTLRPKKEILRLIDTTFEMIKDVYFLNCDFRDFFRRIDYRASLEQCFCYCDPPYVNTESNYSENFKEKDSIDLFDVMEKSGVKYAISEFNQPFILAQAEQRGLNVHYLGERQNIMNKRTEILITNYQNKQYNLFN